MTASLHNAKATPALQKPSKPWPHVSGASKIFNPCTLPATARAPQNTVPKIRPSDPGALNVNKHRATNLNFANTADPDIGIVTATPQRHRHFPPRRPPPLQHRSDRVHTVAIREMRLDERHKVRLVVDQGDSISHGDVT